MIPTESQEQAALVQWFKLRYKDYRLFAIPNGAWLAGSGGRKFGLVAKMKAEGLESGVPDLMLPVARKGCHGLFIEILTVYQPKRHYSRRYFLASCFWGVVVAIAHTCQPSSKNLYCIRRALL